MAIRFLADVEPDEGQTEGRDPPQHVEQSTVGDDAVSRCVEGSVAQPERLGEIVDALERARWGILIALAGEARLDPVPREIQPPPNIVQEGSIGLGGMCNLRLQVLRRCAQRQLSMELIDLLAVQRDGGAARDQAGAPGDVRRHRRIAVPIAADPRSEPDGRHAQRQIPAREPAQRPIQ